MGNIQVGDLVEIITSNLGGVQDLTGDERIHHSNDKKFPLPFRGQRFWVAKLKEKTFTTFAYAMVNGFECLETPVECLRKIQ